MEELAHGDYDQQRSPDVGVRSPETEERLKRRRRAVMTHKVACLDLCSRGAWSGAELRLPWRTHSYDVPQRAQ